MKLQLKRNSKKITLKRKNKENPDNTIPTKKDRNDETNFYGLEGKTVRTSIYGNSTNRDFHIVFDDGSTLKIIYHKYYNARGKEIHSKWYDIVNKGVESNGNIETEVEEKIEDGREVTNTKPKREIGQNSNSNRTRNKKKTKKKIGKT